MHGIGALVVIAGLAYVVFMQARKNRRLNHIIYDGVGRVDRKYKKISERAELLAEITKLQREHSEKITQLGCEKMEMRMRTEQENAELRNRAAFEIQERQRVEVELQRQRAMQEMEEQLRIKLEMQNNEAMQVTKEEIKPKSK